LQVKIELGCVYNNREAKKSEEKQHKTV